MNISKKLINWYKTNKRDLPWRQTKDPYKIWVSEIILQQTRIGQGMEYYHRFLERFESIGELAAAPEEDVLKIWQGLGYYTRARNMHATAREIMKKYNGEFPDNYEKLLGLRGIGTYTAAAVASIAFNQPYIATDGNILRFLSRYFGIKEPVDRSAGKRKIRHVAAKWLDKKDPGIFNQSLMEFGALQCVPVKPDCGICPLKQDCIAFKRGLIDYIPVRSKTQKIRNRCFNYLVILKKKKNESGNIFLRKRTENDIWKNLYDFPLIESERTISPEKLKTTPEWEKLFHGQDPVTVKVIKPFKHVLSHQAITAFFYIIRNVPDLSLPFREISVNAIHKYPIPRLIEKFVKEYGKSLK